MAAWYRIVQHHDGDEPDSRPLAGAYESREQAEQQAVLEQDGYWQRTTVERGSINESTDEFEPD
jgi:hypothetical protein